MARSRRGNVEAVAGALAVLLIASSANAVMVTLVPSSATIPTVGGTTVVNVNIANVTGLESIGFNITYTAAIASVSMVQASALTEDCGPLQITNEAGRLTILAPCPVMPIAGSGTLFSITFNGLANGSTPLAFTTLIVNGTVRIPNGCLLNEGVPSCEPVNGNLTVGGVATPTATRTSTRTATRTSTLTATRTSTRTATRTNTLTPTRTLTASRTPTASNTPTGVINTPTVTNTALPATFTATATSSRTATLTATITNTPTPGPSGTATNTIPAPSTATVTPTLPATQTASITLTPSLTATVTNTFTEGPTATVTATATITNTAPATSTRPGIPVIPSPISPAGIVLISGLAVALLWALQRLQRPQ